MFLNLSCFQRYDFSFKISYTSDQYPSSNVCSDLKWHKYPKYIAYIPRNYCNRQTNRCLFNSDGKEIHFKNSFVIFFYCFFLVLNYKQTFFFI